MSKMAIFDAISDSSSDQEEELAPSKEIKEEPKAEEPTVVEK